MKIAYSGYEGTYGNRGNEYIKIEGAPDSTLRMGVYPFKSGSASVTYSWKDTDTQCCRGTGPCTGTYPTT